MVSETDPLLGIENTPEEQNIDSVSDDVLLSLRSRLKVVRSLIPLNNDRPHIRRLGKYSTTTIFIGRMIGSGIFATPGLIMKDASGSGFLYLIFWSIAAVVAYTGLSLYLELGSYLPVNGATKKFLEYIYPKPRYMTTVVFSIFTLLFSFSSANALVFGEYIRYSFGYKEDEHKSRQIACALIIVCSALHGYSKKVGIACQNVLGSIKIVLLLLIAFTCFYVLILPSSITKIENHFDMEHMKLPPFSTLQGSTYAMAVIKCIHSFGGWTTCHIFQNEIKNPIKTLKMAGPLSMGIIFVLYLLLNLCYLKVIPYEDFSNSKQLAGAILFSKVYGKQMGTLMMNLMIAISSAVNVMIVIYTDSIMNQEIFKEGFLPYSRYLCSNYPFGTPLSGILVHGLASCIIMFIPKKQIYNYIVSIQYYPNQLFHSILCLGLLFKVRKRFPNIIAPIRASTPSIYTCLIGSLSVVISPFMSGNCTFTLCTFAALFLGAAYWIVKFRILPHSGKYRLRTIFKRKKDGLIYKHLHKVYD